jgi:A/G-specific adenine glycosylase
MTTPRPTAPARSVALLSWYAEFGRRHLPWRASRDPYLVVVSEFMLQQTQVERVIPLFEAFLAVFPSFNVLAAASAGDVVRMWRGLGYNTRALRLHALARAVVETYGGALPRGREELLALPGIGPYTVAAVRAFAFEEDEVALDTNIRRIVHRTHLGVEFPARASNRELDELARADLPLGAAHDWNSAMMDVGSTICTARAPKCLICPLFASCAAAPVDASALMLLAKQHARRTPQEAIPFERTTRFLRGRIVDRLRDVPNGSTLGLAELIAALDGVVPPDRIGEISSIADALVRDGILVRSGDELRLA